MRRVVLGLLLTACVACSPGKKETEQAPVSNQVLSPGKQVFERWCASCHASGSRRPGTAALAAKYKGQLPAALEERQDLTPDVVRYFVRHGVSIMPSFRKTEITDAELDALAAHLNRGQPGDASQTNLPSNQPSSGRTPGNSPKRTGTF